MVYEAQSSNGTTAVVERESEDSYRVRMRCDQTGSFLPYAAKGFRLDQAKARADRWARAGGPMR